MGLLIAKTLQNYFEDNDFLLSFCCYQTEVDNSNYVSNYITGNSITSNSIYINNNKQYIYDRENVNLPPTPPSSPLPEYELNEIIIESNGVFHEKNILKDNMQNLKEDIWEIGDELLEPDIELLEPEDFDSDINTDEYIMLNNI